MDVTVVGGGLAGCEAAWQLAERGHRVALLEMRPQRRTPAHQTSELAELVCTNSFKSEDTANAHGLLKAEMRRLGSLLLESADRTRVPAGSALAVDRARFSAEMSARIASHPRIRVERREATRIPDGPTVLASGPLTSDALSAAIRELLGDDGLAFYDSIAPIVDFDSIDLDFAYFASRYGKGGAEDYLNCPLDREQYVAFIAALRDADVYPGHDWEELPHERAGLGAAGGGALDPDVPYFEGCLPIEVLAERGEDTPRFGPMKPVGLPDPRTGREPYAVVQLRREDRRGLMWNMVGFQTRLRTGEQRRIFRMIPGLADADFLRTGSIHRNTYLNFPERLSRYGAPQSRPDVMVAGQLTGVEGYTESAASGILAGINLDRLARGLEPELPPPTTMIGGLYRFLHEASPADFQPMNSNFGLLDPLERRVRARRERRELLARRALEELDAWLEATGTAPVDAGAGYFDGVGAHQEGVPGESNVPGKAARPGEPIAPALGSR